MAGAELDRSNTHAYRTALRYVMSPVLRAETVRTPEYDGIAEFEKLLLGQDTYQDSSEQQQDNEETPEQPKKQPKVRGGVVVFKHFSLKDPPLIVKQIALLSEVMKRRKIVVPSALHQVFGLEMVVSKHVEVKIDPIVTENTVKHAVRKGREVPKLGEGNLEFLRDAVEALKTGGLVFIAPEGERKSDLEPYYISHDDQAPKRPIGFLLAAARREKVSNIAFLFVDLRLAGRKEEYWDKRGFNPLNKYEARIGRAMTYEEVMNESNGDSRKVEEAVIFPEMQKTAAIIKPNKTMRFGPRST